jgi:hypothetical protein
MLMAIKNINNGKIIVYCDNLGNITRKEQKIAAQQVDSSVGLTPTADL